MAKKGRIDDIVDIPKIEEQIKFLTGSLDTVIKKIEAVSEVSTKIKFEGFGKSKTIKDATIASDEFNQAMKEAEPLMKELNSLMKNKSTLEAKLITLETEQAKKTAELKIQTQARNKAIQDEIRLNSTAVGSLNRMRLELERLKKAYANAGSDSERKSILPGIEDLSKKVTEAEHAMGVFNRQVGNYEIAGKSMRTELRAMTEQLARMKAQGLEDTDAFIQLRAKAGELADTMSDARAEITKFASDTKSLDQFISVVEGLAGAYTVMEGATALMGVENEDLQKTFVKLQAAMAVLNGLRAIQNVLQKESAAYTLAENLQKKLGILLTYAQTKAETGGIVTRKLATAAQWALNAAMSANPAGLLLAALAALVAIGFVLFKVFTSNAKIQETYSRAIEDSKRKVEDLNRELERNVKIMEASGASQQDIIREKIKAAEQEYDTQSRLISQLLGDYRHLSDDQKEQLKELQNAQRDNNNKIASLNDDLITNTIKQNRDAAKLKVDNLQEGVNKELALLKFNYDQQVQEAGNNKALLSQLEAKYHNDINDIRKKAAEAYLKTERSTISKLSESRIGLMKEGFSKELASLRLSYADKISDLQDQLTTEENLTVAQRKRIRDTIINLRKALAIEEEKLIVDAQVKANDKQIELINVRLAAVQQGSDDEFKLKLRSLELHRQNEIANAEQTGIDVASIDAKYNKLKADESLNFLLSKLNKESQQKILAVEKDLQAELKVLRDQLENKKITTEEFAKQREALENKYNIKRAENQLRLAKDELQKIKESGGDTLSAEQKLAEAQMALDDAKTGNFINNRDKEKAAQQKLTAKLTELGQEMFDTISGLQNAQFTEQLSQIDQEAKKDEEAKDRELKLAGGNKAAEDAINAKYDAKQKERDAQRKQVELEQAKFAKTMALFQIGINTAMAISKIWAEVPKVDFGVSTIALTAAAGIMGALQAALVAAQPLPQYFKGRDNGPAEWAIVGEQGTEAIEHNGKVSMTPDKPSLAWLPAGAKVIPHNKIQELVASYVVEPMTNRDYYDFQKLEDKLSDLTRAVVNKKEFHLNITEKGMHKLVKSGQSWQQYLDSNVRL